MTETVVATIITGVVSSIATFAVAYLAFLKDRPKTTAESKKILAEAKTAAEHADDAIFARLETELQRYEERATKRVEHIERLEKRLEQEILSRQQLAEEFRRERITHQETARELEQERTLRATLEDNVATMRQTIMQLQEDLKKALADNEQLKRDNRELRRQNKQLLKRLNETGQLTEEPKTDPTLRLKGDNE